METEETVAKITITRRNWGQSRVSTIASTKSGPLPCEKVPAPENKTQSGLNRDRCRFSLQSDLGDFDKLGKRGGVRGSEVSENLAVHPDMSCL